MFKRLPPVQQKAIGQKAISESNISHIAQYHQVSRNTVYAQQRRAQSALNDEFLASTPDDKVLFHIPITKVFYTRWLSPC
jgi:DNA-directed RNA polymerase specialized sigma24 family protein